jgi:hypothetical protein
MTTILFQRLGTDKCISMVLYNAVQDHMNNPNVNTGMLPP